MVAPLPRRPRFLAHVPEVPSPEPVSFAPASQAMPPPPSRALPAHIAPPQALDLDTIRREAMERVKSTLETLRAQSERLAEQARSDAIEIGFLVARKILETELRQSPDTLFSLVRSALRRAGESRRIALRLSPEDAALCESDRGKSALEGISTSRIELVADPTLERGDCTVETDFGQVDGRLGTRFSEIRRAVDSAEGAR
ncbi:MAG TPA: FliH/SctL family protein [Anaeromyxobacteraceae bacterium]|nr:FliH/SctL family protein [Anaeromyxobacteraceae bacterium]